MTPAPLVSVVIPAHNERQSLPRLVVELAESLSAWPHEIILVDDGSTDGTWAEIVAISESAPHVRGVRFTRNFGQQAALIAGLRAAAGEAVVTMDADGQHPADLVPALIDAWQRGHLIVQTIRQPSGNERWLKRATSDAFYRLWSVLSGVSIVRGASDFRLLDRRVVDALLSIQGSLGFLRGLVYWMGWEIHYVNFDVRSRTGGMPAYTWKRMLAFSLDGLTAFSVVPLRLAMALGVSMALLACAYLGWILVALVVSNRVVPGWASTAGLIALIGGIQLFTIGVLGEYVGRIFLRTTDRPQFVIAESTMKPPAATRESTVAPDRALVGATRGRSSSSRHGQGFPSAD